MPNNPKSLSALMPDNGAEMPADLHVGIHAALSPWGGFWQRVFAMHDELTALRRAAETPADAPDTGGNGGTE